MFSSWISIIKSRSSSDIDSRFSEFGPLDIKDYESYLKASKTKFYRLWTKPFMSQEKISDYELLRHLGSGSFGDVVLAECKNTKKHYAIKVLSKEKMVDYKQVEHVFNEKAVLQGIDCPFAIYLVSFFMDNSYLYFVLPFVEGGALFQHLVEAKKFDEVETRFYVAQVVLALEYLHYLDLIYRDIKPENILIDHTGYLKLADFGFCKQLKDGRTYSLCGTPEYLAPEVILGKGYGKAVDWWGVGVLAFELASGEPPFRGKDSMETYERIVASKIKMPKQFSAEMKHLVGNFLQRDLSKRLGNLKDGTQDVKQHKWFRPICWMSLLNRKITAFRFPTKEVSQEKSEEDDDEELKVIIFEIDKEDKYADKFSKFE